jgi:hypothetical protein
MPSIHIPEDTFAQLIEQEGGFQEAKQAVKEAARERVQE